MPTSLDRDAVKRRLDDGDLRGLFIEDLGWDHGGADVEAEAAGRTFALEAVAHKRGMVAYRCAADSEDALPDHPARQKIEKAVARIVREHLIVYAAPGGAQYWQWVKREPGRPDRTRTHIRRPDQPGEALIQKLEQLVFTLDEEEDLTLVDVSGRVRAAFDVEKVTRRFYDRFRQEHRAFLGFIEGVAAAADREWYASLMLNRMMFIYFIQKRGFLDGDPDYLRNRLARVRGAGGGGRFHRFYRLFLLRLFHEGLGQPAAERAPELAELLGRIPYLNGGLFDVHDLECDNPAVGIPDEAFERIFAFFDAYDWHLDDRPLRKDNEINPDVLGYIFEKYVNQKRLLSDDPDRYFHEAVRHGVTWDVNCKAGGQALAEPRALPPDVAAGVDDAARRLGNEPAPPDYGLPTETWREHVARRRRCEEVRARLAAGEVASVNDLITYNLDVEKFAQDVIAASEGPELVRDFWKALRGVSVLDPTCGSGAFLFAALGVLEPLYNACLDAMRGFLDDAERAPRKRRPEYLRDFRAVLDEVGRHASERYFVLKSIVIDNLYGVDVMEEAVEICKLRLFLKLVAQLDGYEQIEPLPDVDFNVRAGNTLVGFTSLEEVKRTLGADLVKQLSLPQIEERAEVADRAFRQFRAMQTEHGMEAGAHAGAKRELRRRLDELRDELDEYLAGDYGVKSGNRGAFRQWRESHQPFHWFVEFHGIMNGGGFDVIIGNPPYVSAGKVRKSYAVKNLASGACPDIYAWILERCSGLLKVGGRTGMITPLSLGFSSGFYSIRRLLFSRYRDNWFSSFGRIPSALFSFDVRVRNTIHAALKSAARRPGVAHTTRLHRWYDAARPMLFSALEYTAFDPALWKYRIPKLNGAALADSFERLLKENGPLDAVISPRPTSHVLHFKQTAYNWLNFCRKMPPCYDNRERHTPHTQFATVHFRNSRMRQLALLLGNGKLLLVFWAIVGDDFHVTRGNFTEFPLDFEQLPEPIGC